MKHNSEPLERVKTLLDTGCYSHKGVAALVGLSTSTVGTYSHALKANNYDAARARMWLNQQSAARRTRTKAKLNS